MLEKSAQWSEALIAIAAHWRDWLRPLEEWTPTGETEVEQFRSLITHLFALYPVPPFLESAWRLGLSGDGLKYQTWYKQLARGESVHDLAGMPISLSHAVAHQFRNAPDDLDIPSAIRWAQIMGRGGNDCLARLVINSRIGIDQSRDEFWLTVIDWFIANPELPPAQFEQIVDYIHDQKFRACVPNPNARRAGQARQPGMVPPQPDYSIKGRTPASLLRAAEAWREQMRTLPANRSLEWTPSPLPAYRGFFGMGSDRRVYAITELISFQELWEEGTAMHHCVAQYWRNCWSGRSSIWSMTTENSTGESQRLLTLNILSDSPHISELGGHCNRLPTPSEIAVLLRWRECGGPGLPERYRPCMFQQWHEDSV